MLSHYVNRAFQESIEVKQAVLLSDAPLVLSNMAERIITSFKQGGKLMLCGNGGSAADAQHLAAELLVRLRSSVDRLPLPALSLATDISTLTACGNDYSFDDIFERPLRALGRSYDVLLAITTSGNSKNIIKALRTAHEIGIATMGFLGGNGGHALDMCDLAFIPPSYNTARIQEAHITAGHALMEMIEDKWMQENS